MIDKMVNWTANRQMSKGREILRTVNIQYYNRKCKVKKNALKEFREAVQFTVFLEVHTKGMWL